MPGPIETYGNYQLIEKLAVGGMAQLFLARRKQKGQERTVVLKRILPHLAEDTAFVTMFLDEARIAARLHHPNVIEILDLGAEGDSYFIAMEYIHGEDLRRISKRSVELGRRMPPALVCRVVAQACRGLDYAHRRADAAGKPLRIVHRDVSPQNILVGFDGQVKVVDFGIAKAVDKATVTASGVIKGKHAYMSPEQALGREIDHRTDVFALGIVLYETLTATRLFRRATDLQTLKAVSECRVDPPSKAFPAVPAQLDAIIMKALTKDLTVRYQHAEELAQELEGWLGDRPDGTFEAVGTYVSELFADRLEREQREGKIVPTKSAVDFGQVSRSGQPMRNGPTASLRVEKKTVTDLNEKHAAATGASPLESRTTDVTPAFVPQDAVNRAPPDRITEPVPAAKRADVSSGNKVAVPVGSSRTSQPKLDEVPQRPSRPKLDEVPQRPSKPKLDQVPTASDLPKPTLAPPGYDYEPPTISHGIRASDLGITEGGAGNTTPYGKAPGTQMYGGLDPMREKTLLEPAVKLPPYEELVTEVPAPAVVPAPVVPTTEIESTTKQRPSRGVMWPWWLAAGLTTFAVAGVVAKVLIDRRDLLRGVMGVQTGPETTTASTPDASIVAAVAGGEGAPKPEVPVEGAPKAVEPMKPIGSAPVAGAAFALVRKEKQLFAQGAAALAAGEALRVVGPAKGGTSERDLYGVGSVVEVKDGEARVLFDEADTLPDGLFVTAEAEKVRDPPPKPEPVAKPEKPEKGAGGALVGSLSMKQGDPKADVALKNATDFPWTGCEVRLPDNRALRLGGGVVVKAGGTQWISGASFRNAKSAPDSKQSEGFAFVKCAEGDGYLKAAMLP